MSSASGFGNVAIIPNLTLFRGVTAAALPPVAFLQGASTPNDGGQGFYQVNLTDKTTADNGTSVIVDGGGFRWELVTTDTSTQIIASLTANGTRPALLPILGGIYTVASAATINLALATQAEVTVTGSTGPVTSLGTVAEGMEFTLRFTGTPTLTYNATSLILPTGANIVVAAGDTAKFLSLGGGNWVCIGYQRASGAALAASFSALTGAISISQLGVAASYYLGYNLLLPGVNFNSANTDNPIPVLLPDGFTRYIIGAVRTLNCTGTLNAATIGVFTATNGGGIAIVTSGSGVGVTTGDDTTNGNATANTVNNANTLVYKLTDVPIIYYRVQNPQGTATTGTVAVSITPIP